MPRLPELYAAVDVEAMAAAARWVNGLRAIGRPVFAGVLRRRAAT